MSPADLRADLVIIGAGPAGAALAAVMARAGFEIVVLERSCRDDRTRQRRFLRGEWIAPWGVEQLQTLGLYDCLVGRGQTITRHIRYERRDGDIALDEDVLDLAGLVPGVPGPLGIEYGRLRSALIEEARRRGARVLDGVHIESIVTGLNPAVRYTQGGLARTCHARLIVGADGRSSTVRKKLGIPLKCAPLHHYICGLLVGGVDGWPSDTELNAVGRTTTLMANAVGGGRFRTYLYFDPETFRAIAPNRLMGAYRAALRMEGLAEIAPIAAGDPVGPCLGLPNSPTWTEHSYCPGVVLIGDAGGSDDPITGQGLSAAFRDVRLVAAILTGTRRWTQPGLLRPYNAAKSESLRRLRFTSAAFSIRDAEFTPEARRTRKDIRARLFNDPTRGLGLLSQYIGPDRLPADAFSAETWNRIFASAVPPPDFIVPEARLVHAESLCV